MNGLLTTIDRDGDSPFGSNDGERTPDAMLIRESIAEKVNSILWLDKLTAEDNAYQERLMRSRETTQKCMICTLPHGTCEHTSTWIENSYAQRTRPPDDEDLDKTINDMLNVIGDFKIETKAVMEDIDLDQMQWKSLEERPTDKIGSTNVCLFSPDERGWHSTVKLTDNLILVFGGLKYRINQVPPMFTVVPHPQEVEYLNDIRAYDAQNLAWYGVRAKGKRNGERDFLYPNEKTRQNSDYNSNESSVNEEEEENEIFEFPEGRYGHIAAALDSNRMLIFGGKGAGGRNLRDTWIYYYDADRWRQVSRNDELSLPLPKARYFSACVSVPIPPLGRARETSAITCRMKETDRDIYMFGGTSGTDYFGDLWVFRGSESSLRWEPLITVGVSPSPRFGHQMVVLYDEKGVEANDYQNGGQQLMVLGGCTFRPQADMVGRNLVPSELSHQVHTIAGSMQATKLAKRAEAKLDVFVLSITELIWRSMAYPGIKGTLPSARMHFSAACIFRHVFVFGGLEASALRYNYAEKDQQTSVYVLDMSTMMWRVATAINSHDHLKEPIRIAQADVIRAVRRCDEEKLRGMSLGALNGKTIELAEAQCVLEVCKWRQSVLLNEQQEHTSAPPSRWGATLTAHGQRVLYIGGWEHGRAVPKGKSAVLNVEQEHERRRRLDDEYSAKLHRDRIREQAEANMANVQSTFELRAIKEAELANQKRELHHMALEDALSALPPLSKPAAVQLVKANRHTMWVQWPRLLRNSKRELVDADSITYFLYVRVGFEKFGVADRVFATVPSAAPKVKHRNARAPLHAANQYLSPSVFFDEECKRYPAEITKCSGDGLFDLLFDDGTVEKDVPRHRLKLSPPLNLTAQMSSSSRPGTANSQSSSRPSTAESISSRGSEGSAKKQQIQAGRLVGRGARSQRAPSRSRGQSPQKLLIDDGEETAERPGTAAEIRMKLNSALLAACAEAASKEKVSSVVPLEFAAIMRNRVQQRQKKRERALIKIDKTFRGVKELSPEELRKLAKESRRKKHKEKEQHKQQQQPQQGGAGLTSHSSTISLLTDATLQSSSNSPRGVFGSRPDSLNVSDMMIPTTHTSLDELFSYGEPVNFVSICENSNNHSDHIDRNNHIHNNGQLIRYSPEEATVPALTVKVDPRWKLVYVGNDNSYSCTNLVPEDALEREQGLSVPVAFCYQVHGADEPYYERSQLSTMAIFFTHSAFGAASETGKRNRSNQKKKGLMRTNDGMRRPDDSVDPKDSNNNSGGPTGMSKTKKEIVSAVLAGQQIIQIEKLNGACLSHGVADSYL